MSRPDTYSYRLAPVRLYRAELEEIARIASEGRVEFRCEGYLYDSVDDLADNRGPAVKALVIQPLDLSAAAAAISILPHHVEVFALSPSAERAEKAVAFLKSFECGQPTWWRIVFVAVTWLVSIVIAALVMRYGGLPQPALTLIAALAAVAFASLLTSMQRALGESVIHLHSRRSHLHRPSLATLVIALLSGLIGLVVGLLA